MYAASYPFLFQLLTEAVTFLYLYDVDIIDVCTPGANDRKRLYHSRELLSIRVRMGSTLPVSELFKRVLGIDTVFFSFSTTDEDFHSPNEFFRVNRLHEGLEAWARYWEAYGAR